MIIEHYCHISVFFWKIKDNNNVLELFFIVWYQTTVMISINVIIFCNYMFCEVYKSHPWRHGYSPDVRRISAIRTAGSGGMSNIPWHICDESLGLLERPLCVSVVWGGGGVAGVGSVRVGLVVVGCRRVGRFGLNSLSICKANLLLCFC